MAFRSRFKRGIDYSYLLLIGAVLIVGWSIWASVDPGEPDESGRVLQGSTSERTPQVNNRPALDERLTESDRVQVDLGERDPLLPTPGGEKRGPDDDEAANPHVNGVYFSFWGNHSFSSQEIVDLLRLPVKVTHRQVERRVSKQVLGFYQARGFAKATVRVGASGSAPMVAEVVIQEGDSYLLGEIVFEGLESLSAEKARSFYPVSGKPLDWPSLRRSDALLRTLFKNSGFLNVRVKGSQRIMSGTHQLNYTVHVEEGGQYRVRAVSVPPALEGRFPVRKGEVYRPNDVAAFLAAEQIRSENLVVDEYSDRSEVEITILD